MAGEAYPQDLADFSLPGLRDWLNQLLKQGFATATQKNTNIMYSQYYDDITLKKVQKEVVLYNPLHFSHYIIHFIKLKTSIIFLIPKM